MSDTNFTQTMNAAVWTEEFISRVKENPDLATDEGAMLGWFANAIMAGFDEARRMYEVTNKYESDMRHAIG